MEVLLLIKSTNIGGESYVCLMSVCTASLEINTTVGFRGAMANTFHVSMC